MRLSIRHRLWPLATALLCLVLCACSSENSLSDAQSSEAGHWQVSDVLTITRLESDLWLHTTWHSFSNQVRFPSHGLIVDEGEHLILVDTAWGEGPTEALLNWVQRELDKPVAHVIVTHFHDDRLGGVPVLDRRSIPYYLSPMTTQLVAAEGTVLDSRRLELHEPGDTIRLGSVEVFYPGPAHTRDNVVVYLSSRQTLFGGCAVRPGDSGTAGNVADADVIAWPDSIRRIQQRYQGARRVIPSHGEPAGQDLLQHTIDILDRHNSTASD